MTGTTPLYGWPFAQPSDARGAGANAMRDLALAASQTVKSLDDREADHAVNLWFTGTNDGTEYAIPNGTAWTALGYQSAAADGFSLGDGGVWTYNGARTRWAIVTFSSLVAVNGTQPSSGLRLLHNGTVADELYGEGMSMASSFAARLDPGNTLQLQAFANDGSGSLGGAHRFTKLRAVTV